MKNFGLIFSMILVSMFTSAQIIHVPGEYTTIQAAIHAAIDGDTVLVAEGTYLENINFLGKPITVASLFILDGDTAHISKTVIDGSQPTHPDTASVVTMISGEDSTSVLNGFMITGGTGTKNMAFFGYVRGGGGINITNSGGKIENNIITGNHIKAVGYSTAGGGIGADPGETGSNIVIRNNLIIENSVESSSAYAQGGGMLTGSNIGMTLVENNVFHNNIATCTGVYKANAGGLMLFSLQPWNATLIVRNNIIRDNEVHCVASHGGGIFLTFPPFTQPFQNKKSGIEIYNNVIANNYCEEFGGGLSFWDQNSYGDKWLSPSPLIYNNTIVGNKSAKGAGIHNFDARILLFNNIIWNDLSSGATEIYNGDLPPYPITYSKVNDGIVEAYYNIIGTPFDADDRVIELGNIYKDPILESGASFELPENSPAIGRGIDSLEINGTWYYATESDINGNIRSLASADGEIDMGALESPFDRPETDYNSEHVINVPGEESTIQAAIDAALDGDTVLVDEGYYYENINFKGKAITVASKYILDKDEAHIAQTVIDGSQASDPDNASVVKFENCLDTTSVLSGFTITGGPGTRDYVIDHYIRSGGGIYMFNAGGKVTHNIVTGNSIEEESDLAVAAGIGVAYFTGESFNTLIRNNSIHNNHTKAPGFSFGAGISAHLDVGFLLIENNEVFNNTSTCTASYKALGAGIDVEKGYGSPGMVIIRNNYIHHNQAICPASMGGGIYLVYHRNQSMEDLGSNVPVEIYNNIISDNYSEDKGGGIGIWNMAPIYGLNQKVPDPIISNNTIINNRATEGPGIFNYDAETVLFNNIIWNQVLFTAHEVFNENISYPGHYPKTRNDGIIHAYNNIFKQPLILERKEAAVNSYLDPVLDSGSPFDLPENSPAIGRGCDSLEIKGTWYYAPNIDFSGNSRPGSVDSFVDLGAYESPFSRKVLSTANLASIDMAGTTLIPPFSSDTLKYILRMPENFDYVNGLIAIPEDALAKMEINHATDIFSENIEDRSTTISVTSSDSSTSKVYQVEFRPLSTDASLSALSVSQGSLDPAFDPGIFSYEVLLPSSTAEVPTISYLTSNEHATAEVTNAIDLYQSIEAYRTSRVDVTAQDGITEETYKIVFRLAEVGTEDLNNANRFSLFPNPLSTYTTLEWSVDKCINRIVLVDMTGKVLRVMDEPFGNTCTLNRGDLPSGLYFLRVYGDETCVLKLVIR